jgi:hypothetical protein
VDIELFENLKQELKDCLAEQREINKRIERHIERQEERLKRLNMRSRQLNQLNKNI